MDNCDMCGRAIGNIRITELVHGTWAIVCSVWCLDQLTVVWAPETPLQKYLRLMREKKG